MVVSSVATTATTTAVVCEDVCVPPVTVDQSYKFDAGNLPLSSYTSKQHVCINSNNKKKASTSYCSSFQKHFRVCCDIWDLPRTCMVLGGPRNEAVTTTGTVLFTLTVLLLVFFFIWKIMLLQTK